MLISERRLRLLLPCFSLGIQPLTVTKHAKKFIEIVRNNLTSQRRKKTYWANEGTGEGSARSSHAKLFGLGGRSVFPGAVDICGGRKIDR